ncbi:MAG: hypothetical protein NC489_08385 [Ruminococcus flavefaciens]|nr:hypothetical protein [Ruminococcus flavefaciens]
MAVKMQEDIGLWTDVLPTDVFVKVNQLERVSNPVMLDSSGRGFTSDGVLSNEIFGISTYDRRNRFAYIELYTHYMTPLAAVKLASYDRKLADVLFARGRYKLTKGGELIEDPDGKAGPEFLYQIWGKVKVKDKETVATKEIQKFYEQNRDILFCTKFPVIPAFYRDINKSAMSSGDSYEIRKSSALINSRYNSMISYAQSINQYTDTFTGMAYITQARIQSIIVDIYNDLVISTVKGSPSKFGMLRRALAGKNLPYTSRLVVTAANQNRSSLSQVQTKYGYATVPLMYVCAMFMPFIVHDLKAYFDAQFLQGGKYPIMNDKGELEYVTITESYDENAISGMIIKFINSPESRFDLVKTPPDTMGRQYNMMLTGRFNKDNTTMKRNATLTDILYIVASKSVADKHVDITRYPMDNPNGQNPFRIIISTTMKTEPVTIGETVYDFFPVIEGDPLNVFMTTGQISNVMADRMGMDYDGDQVSLKPRWTKESNADAERLINSPGYTLDVAGKTMRQMGKDFILNSYLITKLDNDVTNIVDINKTKPKYVV